MSENKGVWVYSENKETAIQMLDKGKELANRLKTKLTVLLMGNDAKNQAKELVSYGVEEVIVAQHPQLNSYQAEAYLGIVTELVKKYMPDVLLVGSTRRGKELAARLATRLNIGCIPNCGKLSVDDQGRLVTERMVYGGNASAIQTFLIKPQVACVSVGSSEKPKPQGNKGTIIEENVQNIESPKTQTTEIKPVETAAAKIEDARVVVIGGRGVEKKEDFSLLEELAEGLGGQRCYTRPIAEDRKWFKGNWVGLSGHTIKPELYIGCGNAGVIQHIAGIRDSKIIVSINKDPEAPICEIADYIITGDLYQIVPALTAALKKIHS